MCAVNRFGGAWTQEKLIRLEKYLRAYSKLMANNQWAKKYIRWYVDAFAGTGTISPTSQATDSTLGLFDSEDDLSDFQRFYDGSARVALQVEPAFHHYLFVDRNPNFVQQLQELRRAFPNQAEQIDIRQGDANEVLVNWCTTVDWSKNRAVVFLDPYGMSVRWNTLVTIARTKAIDLFLLVPVGQAIMRMLTNDGVPTGAWADKLTDFFGTDEWKQEFYRESDQLSLFDNRSRAEKIASFESITRYVINRLSEEFELVANESLVMRNRRGIPLFVLFFAASNPRGAPTAVNIANDILRG